MLPICITQEVPQCCWHQKKSLMLLLLERRLGSPFGSASSPSQVTMKCMLTGWSRLPRHLDIALPTSPHRGEKPLREVQGARTQRGTRHCYKPQFVGFEYENTCLPCPHCFFPLALTFQIAMWQGSRLLSGKQGHSVVVSRVVLYTCLTSLTFLFRVIFPSVI